MRFQLVLFDYDGTLAHTRPAVTAAIQDTLAAFDRPVGNEKDIHALIGLGLSLEETFRRAAPGGQAPSDEDVELWVEQYRSTYADRDAELTEAFEHLAETLDFLEEAEIDAAVISNRRHDVLTRCLERIKAADRFQVTAGSMPGVPHKPDTSIFEAFVGPHFPATAASDILMVGDTSVDLEFARNLGASSCWVSFGYGDRETCLDLRPDFVIDSLSELKDIIEN